MSTNSPKATPASRSTDRAVTDKLLRAWALAVVPWVAAVAVTLLWAAIFSHNPDALRIVGHDAVGSKLVAVVPAFFAALAIDRRRRADPESVLRSRWVAGAVFAGYTTLLAMLLSVVAGGTYEVFYMGAWSVLSGDIAFLFLLGAYLWKPLPRTRSSIFDVPTSESQVRPKPIS